MEVPRETQRDRDCWLRGAHGATSRAEWTPCTQAGVRAPLCMSRSGAGRGGVAGSSSSAPTIRERPRGAVIAHPSFYK